MTKYCVIDTDLANSLVVKSVEVRGRRVGRRIIAARWALLAYILVLGALVLLPTSPMEIVRAIAGALRGAGAWFVRDGWVEFGANIVMFVPLGLLMTLSLRSKAIWGVVAAGALSLFIELAQVILPSRVASPRDLLANVIGALVGYALAHLLTRWE